MGLLNRCLELIKKSKNIAIFTHKEPDADALASSVAVKKLIKSNIENCDKIIDIFVDYDLLGENNKAILKGVVHNYQRCHKYDLAIVLDCASLARLGKYLDLFKICENKINFDHHKTNENFADYNFVLKTSSTCEGLYVISKAKKLTISDDVCSLIYSGIITDTNNLTQGLITTQTHKIIAEMLDRKINLDALNDHFFKNNTKSKAFLLKKALESLKFFCNDRIAIMKLSKENLDCCDASKEDTLGIVNHGIDIKGVDIAILYIKHNDNMYDVSLRGKNNISVAEIAKAMGGGGHEYVAAFQYSGTFNELIEKLINECKKELSKHPVGEVIDMLFTGDLDEI